MTKKTFLTHLSIPLLAIGTASAALVIPVGIEGFHQGDSLNGNGSILKVIDGSGMTKGNASDPTTWTIGSTAWQDDWQGFSADNTGDNTWVVFNLGAPTADLATMHLWNVQENNALNRGTGTFDIFFATVPTVAPPTTGGTVTPYSFGSGGWTAAGSGSLVAGTQIGDAGQVFDVSAAAGAQYIGLHLTANLGGTRTGLAEVAFTTIPEPGSMTLLLAGGVVALMRRRR